MNIKYKEIESMAMYINRVLESAKDLETASKEVPPDEISYQILEHLPKIYNNLVIQLYSLPHSEFTVEEERKLLLAEYDWQESKSIEVPRNRALLSVHRVIHVESPTTEGLQNESGPQNCSRARQKISRTPCQVHFAAAMMSENLDLTQQPLITFAKKGQFFRISKSSKVKLLPPKVLPRLLLLLT